MGEILKFCSNCNATFLESFTFCPTCANALAPFEMQPVPNMETTPPVETSPPIQSEPQENKNEFIYFSSAIPAKKVSVKARKEVPFGIGILITLILCALFILGIYVKQRFQGKTNISSSTPKNDIGHSTASPTPAPPLSLKENPNPRPSDSPILDQKKSTDYVTGYQRGLKEGRSWAKEVVGSTGMPEQAGIDAMARYQASQSGTKDASAWQNGWADGFVDGYHNIKPSRIKKDDYEPLAWSNAKPNVKLYDHSGNYEATIVSVNQANGTISVKYPKGRGGVTEDKILDSLSSFWFVKK